MSLDIATVKNIATLARIEVSEPELAPLAKELSGILHWVEQLSQVDTEGVAPMTSVVAGMEAPLRKDVVTDGGQAEKVLANGPETSNGFFLVPKVVE
jgi:aspartyl-tRNA(Asn)/glutamyl-tRNA(Gln) amidotransferase subunit C